ncbi:MAG: hypothetical protein A3G32_06725 [Deltaproteobacteria bacterium RIFCSPLOWO2_12_FULL_40_28]|nr:MAG: hypothetical protein A3C45_06770 [Deltaproteobacteria bacterium RIFCSPHIGHO2_02_FULL_40_28]OGQ19347.1 MAG: hypothetical protein A3E27_05045 [Deltaproteobacteria bacterium RIFCSPHIGHO2_12_FULL_40_32]OGQ40429.1 MAG: hypothetical protein A3I69_00025 [Deltaproteobacteria bacterium RIFCSPLOWO2_02_FULL_40_36]OGQ53665.1 MAG: hypothetical protein A3G32_06725 [Deltaproteobacteria bacterium RIFCSPLOWO2_12_FULL_40_28]
MHYQLNKAQFKKVLFEKGYRNLSDLALRSGIHRNTLVSLLEGKSAFVHAFNRLAEALQVDPLQLITPIISIETFINDLEKIWPVVQSLTNHDPLLCVVLFGSRVSKKAQKYSDWDLGVFRYPKPITGMEFLKLKRIVGDASENLVFLVDLVNLNQAPTWFLESTASNLIFLEGHKESYFYLRGLLDGIKKEKAA